MPERAIAAMITTCRHCRHVIVGAVEPPACESCITLFHGGDPDAACGTCTPRRLAPIHPPVARSPKPSHARLASWAACVTMAEMAGVRLEEVAPTVCHGNEWDIIRARYVAKVPMTLDAIGADLGRPRHSIEVSEVRGMLRLMTYLVQVLKTQ